MAGSLELFEKFVVSVGYATSFYNAEFTVGNSNAAL